MYLVEGTKFPWADEEVISADIAGSPRILSAYKGCFVFQFQMAAALKCYIFGPMFIKQKFDSYKHSHAKTASGRLPFSLPSKLTKSKTNFFCT